MCQPGPFLGDLPVFTHQVFSTTQGVDAIVITVLQERKQKLSNLVKVNALVNPFQHWQPHPNIGLLTWFHLLDHDT